MRVELHPHRATVSYSDTFKLMNSPKHLVGIRIQEETLDDQIISSRKEPLEMRLARNHVMLPTSRVPSITNLRLDCGLRPRPSAAPDLNPEEATKLRGILDRDGDISTLPQQNDASNQNK